ncbi:lymphocyte antigen 6E-like [Ambystoma mexicanum]|uniref:lymphocyte antigen 6E-like n=1 Tax=Ambystoma mexicanum TaxID=8296 RepID=UPI0037E83DFC
MGRFLLILLGALLSVHQAHSIICFVCVSQTTNDNCIIKTQNCSQSGYSCMTVVDTSGIGFENQVTLITKSCVTQCSTKNYPVILASYSVSCCNKNFCNFSGTESLTISRVAVALSCVISLLFHAARL